MADKLSILDILSSVKATNKIEKIARTTVDTELEKLSDKITTQISDISKRLSTLEKIDIPAEVTNAVKKGDDQLREIIRQEVGSIFFRLYVKRNAWQ
jgi:Asp-tRNA(Asn)/Glu-tRNA(Gln) amidotransferase C subunit